MSREKHKEALLASAQSIFLKKGIASVTLEEIAKDAKVDAKSAKAVFPKIEDLIDHVLATDVEETTELFTRTMNDRGKADIKLTRLVRELLTRYQKSVPITVMVSLGLEDISADDSYLKNRVKPEFFERFRQNTAILGRLIAQGQSENLFSDADPLEAAYLLRGMISSALRYRRLAGKTGDMRDDAEIIMRVFLKGILR